MQDFQAAAAAERTGFSVLPLHQMGRDGRWRTEAMRSYARPVLYWFTRGQGRLTIQGVTRGYSSHNAVFLPPRTMHAFEMMGQTYGSVLFLPADLDLGLPEEALHLRFRDARQQGELTFQIENIQRELNLGEEAMERALMHQGGLLAVWLERQAAAQVAVPTDERAADRLAAAFSALVERDYHSGAGVAHYAQRLGVTPTHLSRACRHASGRPASALLQDRVHYEARRLLRETRMPIKEIASGLGFRSAAYFTRAFQSRTGQTPSAFRQRR